MTHRFRPAFVDTLEKGVFPGNVEKALAILKNCVICPRLCRVDRTAGERGICRTGRLARVSAFHPHFGEESPLVGSHGSGTIFFTHCNLMCNFCQNWDISHEGWGEDVTDAELADMMLALQDRGCHNINFVTPGHVVPQILAAVEIAASRGLNVPLVYNSGGYDRVETLRLLEGVIDIYMPDFKFWDETVANRACRAPDYPEQARRAIIEMHRQVGDLVIGDDGLAQRGLLVRHLVLPGGLAGTREIMRFIAEKVSINTYVNVMSQYRPSGTVHEIPELSESLTADDYHAAIRAAREEGITRLDR